MGLWSVVRTLAAAVVVWAAVVVVFEDEATARTSARAVVAFAVQSPLTGCAVTAWTSWHFEDDVQRSLWPAAAWAALAGGPLLARTHWMILFVAAVAWGGAGVAWAHARWSLTMWEASAEASGAAPRVRDNVARIVRWAAWWPFSVAHTALHFASCHAVDGFLALFEASLEKSARWTEDPLRSGDQATKTAKEE